MKLTDLLDQIDRLDKEATKGPWTYEHTESPTFISGPDLQEITNAVWSDTDAIYIELARTALPQLAAAVKGVLNVLDSYPAPTKEADPTGYTTARLAQLEHRIREAIGDTDGRPTVTDLPDPRNDAQLLRAYREAATAVLNDPLTLDEHKPDVQPLQFAILAATATAEWLDKHKESRND